jgi:SNF2 family DNA or RNA helicase
LAVPSGVIKQWADTVIDEFPTLTLMISYDESGLSEARYATHFVKATAMKKMEHRELWPERHRYIFDESNSKNATTIILTSHDTLVTRTLQTSVVTVREGKRYAPSEPSTDKFDPHEKNPDGTLKHWEIKPVEKTKYHSNQKGRVGIAGADEAHRMKNEETARWKAFSELDADYIIIIGATPMANVGVVSGLENQFLISTNRVPGCYSPDGPDLACGETRLGQGNRR